jgi:thioredoxin 1
MRDITSKQQYDEILNDGSPALIEFSTSWCAPCKVQREILDGAEEALKKAFPELEIYHLDCDDLSDVADALGIRAVPYLILFNDGEHSLGSGVKDIQRIFDFLRERL